MNTLEQMDFYWEKNSTSSNEWKSCLKNLEIEKCDHAGFGFAIKVDGKKFIDFAKSSYWLMVRERTEKNQNLVIGTEAERSMVTITSPFHFNSIADMNSVEFDMCQSVNRISDEELTKTLSNAIITQDDVWVFFEGFFDSVDFRAEVEKFFGITFPPFSEWRNESTIERRIKGF